MAEISKINVDGIDYNIRDKVLDGKLTELDQEVRTINGRMDLYTKTEFAQLPRKRIVSQGVEADCLPYDPVKGTKVDLRGSSIPGVCTLMIPVESNDTITYSTYQTGAGAGSVIVDENDIVLDFYVNTSEPTGTLKTLVAPQNAKYFYFAYSTYLQEMSDTKIEVRRKGLVTDLEETKIALSNVAEEVEHIKSQISNEKDITNELSWTDGYQVMAEGDSVYPLGSLMVISDSTREASDFFNIKGATRMVVTLIHPTSTASSGGLVFYDKDKVGIKGYFFRSSSVNKYTLETINIPSNAVYFRTTRWSSEVSVAEKFSCVITYSAADELEKPLIGSPAIFISESTDGIELNGYKVSDIYAAYDSLVSSYPYFFAKRNKIGVDASGNYDINRYTLAMVNPYVGGYDPSNQSQNIWDSTLMGNRTIVVVSGIHGNEKSSVYGVYLAIKKILESTDAFANFIKSNFVVEIIPIANPWAFDQNVRVNSNGANLNRLFGLGGQPEVVAIENFLKSLPNLHAVIDSHNSTYVDGDTPIGGSVNLGFVSTKPSFRNHFVYCNAAAKLAGALYGRMSVLWNNPKMSPYITTWISGNSNTLEEYVNNTLQVLCTTVESPNCDAADTTITNKSKWSEVSMAMVVNLIQMFGTIANTKND